MTSNELAGLMKAIAPVIREQIAKSLAPLDRRIAELQSALDIEKAKPRGLDYQGTWQKATAYSHNEGVSHHGSMWVCLGHQVRSEPGTDPHGWQLAVKCGRDGRDAR